MELAANPIPGLELVLAYTYINDEVTADNELPVGTPVQGVPANSFSAWVKYTIQDGSLSGLGIGIGGVYYSKQSGDIANTFDLPAYGVMDTAIYYKRGRYRAQVNFNNVLNSRYFVWALMMKSMSFQERHSTSWQALRLSSERTDANDFQRDEGGA